MTEPNFLPADEFRPILEVEFGYLLGTIRKEARLRPTSLSRRGRFTRIGLAAAEFAAFLDEHGAGKNRTFTLLAELASSLRGLCRVGREVAQIERLVKSDAKEEAWAAEFHGDLLQSSEFVIEAATSLVDELMAEGQRLLGGATPGIEDPEEGEVTPRLLAQDLDIITLPEQEKRVLEIASRLLGCWESLRRESDGQAFTDPDRMKRYVLEVADEQEVRFFETRIHNLLSRYDTYVRGTSLEAKDPELPRLRVHLMVMQHMLRAMNELVHFYERHENDVRCDLAKNRIAALVDKQAVLDCTLNFCLVRLHQLMRVSAVLAEDVVARYSAPEELSLEVPDGVVLHARPVSLITRVVAHHGTPVHMKVGSESCYAGSMLEVLMALGSSPDERTILFAGDDKPLKDLALLFEHGLGELGTPLPEELEYLGL